MHKLKDVHWSQKHTTSLNILPVQVQFFFFTITKNNISGVSFIIYTYEQLFFFFFFFFFLSLFLHLMWTDYQSVSPDIKCLGDFGLPPSVCVCVCVCVCVWIRRTPSFFHSSENSPLYLGRRVDATVCDVCLHWYVCVEWMKYTAIRLFHYMLLHREGLTGRGCLYFTGMNVFG